VEKLLNQESVGLREEAVDCEPRQQQPTRRGQRNGFYLRDLVSRFRTLRLKVARTRERSFLPGGLARFQSRAAEVMLLIREAFLRGLSTRQVGRVVGTLTDEVVSAQTVSKLSPESRPPGESLPPGAFARRVGVFVPGWSEPAGAAAGRPETRVRRIRPLNPCSAGLLWLAGGPLNA
jgi:hypothetical protein